MHMALLALQIPELQRRGSFPLWLAIVIGIIAIAVVGMLYAREAGRLGLIPRTIMASIRVAIVGVVAFLLLRPVLVSESKERRIRPVGVLIDVSQSMDNEDPRPNLADQWRVALAYDKIDADKGLPNDTSVASLGLPERPKRIDVARQALSNPKIDLFKKLSASAGPLDVFTFGTHRTGQNWLDADWLKNLTANEPRTTLVQASFEMLNRDDTDAPSALVLVTDGRENGSNRSLDDLARECARRKIPVYVYGVGSSAFGQLQLKDVNVPETIFVDDLVSVPVRYMVKGIKEGKVEIALNYGDREVARKEVAIQEGKDIRETLTFVPIKDDTGPRKKQELTTTVTVTSDNGGVVETLTDKITRPSQVVDKKLKVLVIDSLPRFDFQFLQRALLRDRRVEAKFYLTEGDKVAMRSGPPWMIEFSRELNGTLNLAREEFRKILFEFDLLILGAVPGRYFSLEQQEVIREFVTDGGGLIHIAGRSYADKPERWTGPAAWAGEWELKNERGETRLVATKSPTPIGEILPVDFESIRLPIQDIRPASPYVPVVAPAAARNPLVMLEDDPNENAELWGKFGSAIGTSSERQLKPFYWYYPVLKTKPAVDVFLVHPTDHTPAPDNKPMPLLVGHYYGKGYVLFVGFDETWRWRFNSAEKLFTRFWSQAIYAAGLPRVIGAKLTQLSLDNTNPTVGGVGQIYARVLNENFKLVTDEELDATLEKVDADANDGERSVTIKLNKLSGQDGEYIAALPFNKQGRYRLTLDPKNRSPATLEYRVNLPRDHELVLDVMDEKAMRKLCDMTGGKFYREEDLYQLPNDVKRQTIATSSRKERLLWNTWALCLLIGLLTFEWFLRKFNGLS